MPRIFAVAAVLGLLASTPGQAAYINVDDSDPDFITITAGDFEGGFSVNGILLTTGLNSSGSVTLADGSPSNSGYSISGSWIDNGAAGGTTVSIPFALADNPTFVTSGIGFNATSDGTSATLSGYFAGYIDPSHYGSTVLTTVLQDGHTEIRGVPFLTVQFRSEAVPEPASLALLTAGLFGLVAARGRRKAA